MGCPCARAGEAGLYKAIQNSRGFCRGRLPETVKVSENGQFNPAADTRDGAMRRKTLKTWLLRWLLTCNVLDRNGYLKT